MTFEGEQGRDTHTPVSQALQDVAEGGIPGEGGNHHPKPAKWMKLVDLLQFMWESGTISAHLVWIILILIPKGKPDN